MTTDLEITAEYMHSKAVSEESTVPSYGQSFEAYVLDRLRRFSGNNYLSRVICSVLTKEYIIISNRPHNVRDIEEMPIVADKLRSTDRRFYVEVDDSNIAKASDTASMVICWDPKVKANYNAYIKLVEPRRLQLYNTVMQYIRAEESSQGLNLPLKDLIGIGDYTTAKWISVPVVAESMWLEALDVAEFLWEHHYFVSILSNARREGTWTMFVSWEPVIVQNITQHPEDYATPIAMPSSWN